MTATRTLPAADRAAAIESLSRFLAMCLPGKELTVTVEEYRPARSTKQRSALFGCAYKALMEQMGLRGERDKEALHSMLCGEWWGWREVETLGSVRRVPVRTTTINADGKRDEISVKEALEFYAFIQERAAEYGFDVPDPDPLWRDRARLDAELEARAA